MAYKNPNDPRAKESRRKHYHNNKEVYKQRALTNKERLREYVRNIKESSPCLDCNIYYPYCIMHFDHLDPSKKFKSVSQLVSTNGSLNRIKEEISKCELVYSNCHATREHKRRYRE